MPNDNPPTGTAHPAREEWMSYLYGESSSEHQVQLANHLAACNECRSNVAEWQRTVQSLDDWKMPEPEKPAIRMFPYLKWGLAAMFAAGFAFWAGRISAPQPSLAAIRSEIHREVLNQTELLRSQNAGNLPDSILAASKAEFQRAMEERFQQFQLSQKEDNKAVIAAIENLSARQAADYANLRGDLETLAVTAQGEMLSARKNFANLAAYTALASTQSETKNQ